MDQYANRDKEKRHFADDTEATKAMGAKAARQALQNACGVNMGNGCPALGEISIYSSFAPCLNYVKLVDDRAGCLRELLAYATITSVDIRSAFNTGCVTIHARHIMKQHSYHADFIVTQS